ncbi:uncharacterized protein LOC110379534 [Helicoverpa armigera]|uniref:Uncharacterized protein n=1 Tax=Helicoverpa armigera TaxID=29058 RepID=A0A2W1BMP7_HELAM|nr:uncharacterized protein LOC110379534 [Helicoverpa armigera]XP_047034210.1 uncharacterized protein LOC124640471 [Helicoverpa zea]PZC74547.1 hypothetical protein B5X24_HaOG207681 [Helicoverpa armigera]
MSEPLRPKMSLSEEMFTSFALQNKSVKTSNIDSDPGTSYEVFRNNTTAVEVIVKEVPKARKKSAQSEYQDGSTIKRLQDDVDRLRNELNIANKALTRSRNGFLAMVREMKKQLDAANQREMDTQTKNLALLLDNEKLKSLLASKTNLVNKFKKELSSMKRVMRYVIKSICYAPHVSTNVTCSSDPEYDDFENDLKKNEKVKFASNMFDEMGTFDSSISKDTTKYSFDKRLL